MVAGWGVGNITLPMAPRFRPGWKRIESCRWQSPHAVKRGEWIATFELGSSVVLITSSSLRATPLVSPNEKVHYGQPVFELPRPTVVSYCESEPGETSQTGDTAERATRSGTVLIASFGNPIAADYAAFVGQRFAVRGHRRRR